MTALENTQSYKDGIEKDKSLRALEKAKRLEKQRIKQGWRHVKVNERLQVFVPCDKNGKPTHDGQRRINAIINR